MPTNIVRSPYDMTPAVTILAVCWSSRDRPFSRGKVKTRGQITDILRPKIIPLKQQENDTFPMYIKKRQITPEQILASMSIFSFLLDEAFTKARKNLKKVIEIQKMVGKMVAPRLSVTPLRTANDEIHPPQINSIPTYKNSIRQREYYMVLETAFPADSPSFFSLKN